MEYKLLLLDVPSPTISKANVVASGTIDSISKSLMVPIPTINVPVTAISSGMIEQDYFYSVPEPVLSYTTGIVSPAAEVKSLPYNVPTPVLSYTAIVNSGSQNTPIVGINVVVPVIGNTPIIETLFNFTRVYSLRAGVYTDQTAAASSNTINDVSLLPTAPAIGDGIVMGIYHPNWRGATIKVSTIGAGTYTVIWEYWSGAAWDALTVIETGIGNGDINNWKTIGYVRVRFDPPPYWDPRTITDVSGAISDELYYIRCRLVAFSSMTIKPLATRIWGGSLPARLLNTRQTMNELIGEYHMTHLPPLTSFVFRSGNAFYWQFKMVNYTDYASQRALATPRVTVSFQGKAFKLVSMPVTEINHGWYIIQIPSTYIKSQVILRATAPGCAQCDMTLDIEPITTSTDLNIWGDLVPFTWGGVSIYTWHQIVTVDL